MTIYVNGRELEERGLVGKSEARKRAGLYPEGLLRVLERSARDELADSRCAMVEEVQELNRALYESGAHLEPPPDLAREGEKKGRLESFLRRFQTRFIRAVCEGYVQQQQLFNSYLSKGLILCFLQVYGREEEIPLEGESMPDPGALRHAEWERETAEAVAAALRGSSCLVLGIPGLELLEALQEKARLVLAVDPSEEVVARAQARMLPAWCGTRFADLLELAGAEGEVVLVTCPAAIPAGGLKELFVWAAGHLPPGGRVLVALNAPSPGGIVDREGGSRPYTRAFISSLMRSRGLVAGERRLDGKVFLEGRKAEDGGAGEGGGAADAGGEGR